MSITPFPKPKRPAVLPVLTMADLTPMDEVFCWQDDIPGSPSLMFHVTKLLEHIDDMRRVAPESVADRTAQVAIDMEFAEWMMENRGVEKPYLRDMMVRMSTGRATERDKRPLVMLEMEDGTHLLVDGTHRYCAAAFLREEDVTVVVVPKGIWQFFVVHGVEELAQCGLPRNVQPGAFPA